MSDFEHKIPTTVRLLHMIRKTVSLNSQDPNPSVKLGIIPSKRNLFCLSSPMETIAYYVKANRLVVPTTYHIIISVLVLLPFPTLLAFTESLSFSFPDPDSLRATRNLSLPGDASPSPSGIELTRNTVNTNLNYSSGWATYHEPLHLWDPTTGRVADFTSNFSFVIAAVPGKMYGDGMSFFLTPNGTNISETAKGGGFALTSSTNGTYDGSYPPFIAVEFDTFINDWDPSYVHVGIDISTLHSVANASWEWNEIASGGEVNVVVMYNSSQQILSVKMTDADNASSFSTVNSIVNLTEHLPEWVTFGFSASTGAAVETHTIRSWSFESSLEVTSNNTKQQPPVTSNENQQDSPAHPSLPPEKKKNNYWQWIIVGAGSVFLLCFVLGFMWFRHQSKSKGGNLSEDEDTIAPIDLEFAKVSGPKMFSLKEVATATNDFSNDCLLGQGGFGRVYKGYLREGNCEVAIKKITPGSKQGIKEYATEVKTISQLRHRNLVQLVGWCHQKKELLLIYEFMSNGSLDTHLFKGKSLLTWEMRYKIAHGLASSLLYLHEEWEQCVLHRDIKASNIMLDSGFNAKLGDFGLARLVDHAKGSQTTVLAGTMGYMAPECVYRGKVGKESDIYSFGVVLLEIACGRRVNDLIDGHIHLIDWVWDLYGIGNLLDAVDPNLGGDYDPAQIQCLMIVGLWCAHPDYDSRPTIREALSVLKFETLPPLLPSKPPIPTYAKPQVYEPFPSSISSFEITSSSSGGGYTTTGSSVPSQASSVITSSSASSAPLLNAV